MNEKKSWLGRALSARGVQSVVTAACGFILLFIIFCILSPQFRSGNNIQNLFRQIAPTMIIGIGQGFVLITGNIDLSIGSVVGMACMTAGTLMSNGVNPWVSCLVALLMSLAIGLVNGVLVAKVGLPSFIATLGTMTLARGLAQLVNNNHNTNTTGGNNYNNNTPSKSTNNKIKEISVEGYDLVKKDANRYTLTVPTDVTSINVKVTAEDAKAKVTGVGNHNLNIGDNNIEVIITSESGSQNKINIKVTRKDGYYLEDLEDVLNNDTIDEVNVNILSDTIISSEELNKIKSSKKIVHFNYNNNGRLLYSWIIDGSLIDNTVDILTTISYDSDNKATMLRLSNYADGLFISASGSNNMPKETKIKLYVGDKYSDGELVNVYSYSKDNEKLILGQSDLKVEDGYIVFDASEADDYLVTMSNISSVDDTTSSSNLVYIIIISLLLLVIAVLSFFLIKKMKNKK